MCFIIFRNANGPILLEKKTTQCNSESHLICGKSSLAKIMADCQYNPESLDLSEDELKKIASHTAYSYQCYDEMLQKEKRHLKK